MGQIAEFKWAIDENMQDDKLQWTRNIELPDWNYVGVCSVKEFVDRYRNPIEKHRKQDLYTLRCSTDTKFMVLNKLKIRIEIGEQDSPFIEPVTIGIKAFLESEDKSATRLGLEPIRFYTPIKRILDEEAEELEKDMKTHLTIKEILE